LKKLDAGRWKDSRWAGTRIPSLDEVLAAVPPGKRLFIEVKCGVEITPELKRLVEASGKKDQLVVIAFSYDVVKDVKQKMPYLPVYWLYGFAERDGRPILSHGQLLEHVKAAGADGLDVYYKGPLTKEFTGQLSASGMKLYVYTVNSPEDARKLANLGVAGITTDRPAYLRSEMEGASK
jgi:glycerophosphoryl diester phosphodiesterase